jgi:hypothetical protein
MKYSIRREEVVMSENYNRDRGSGNWDRGRTELTVGTQIPDSRSLSGFLLAPHCTSISEAQSFTA